MHKIILREKILMVKGFIPLLSASGQKPGGCAFLHRDNRFIYYLVTKQKYWHKPTYDTLTSSLEVMKSHCADNGVTHLCMPRIGCGLDGLQWNKVTAKIKEVFKDLDIKITVYTP